MYKLFFCRFFYVKLIGVQGKRDGRGKKLSIDRYYYGELFFLNCIGDFWRENRLYVIVVLFRDGDWYSSVIRDVLGEVNFQIFQFYVEVYKVGFLQFENCFLEKRFRIRGWE